MPKLNLEVTCKRGKLIVHGKLDEFRMSDTKDQKVLRAFLARLSEVVQEFDSKKE